jgi:hypothetical protein
MRPPLIVALAVLLTLAVPSIYIVSRGSPRRAPWPFRFAWLAAIAVLCFPIAVLLHNVVGGVLGVEEPVFFLLALASLPAFALGVVGALASLLFLTRPHH